jgi:hypothetical protein
VKVQAVTPPVLAHRRHCLRGSTIREDTLRRSTNMLIDEILRALRDPEYRAQLTNEARGAMPDRSILVVEHEDSDQEPAGES